MTYTVTVSAPFNRSCAACRQGAKVAASQAIDDAQVTSITFRVAEKCDHVQPKAGSASALPGQQPLPGLDAAALPNGFDHA